MNRGLEPQERDQPMPTNGNSNEQPKGSALSREEIAARVAAGTQNPNALGEWLEGEGWVPSGTKEARKREGEELRARLAAMTPAEHEAYRAQQLGGGPAAPFVAPAIGSVDTRTDAEVLVDGLLDVVAYIRARRGRP
jgi:hypothetical protein